MFGFKKENVSSAQAVDIIENKVYERFGALGFKKYGRTLHRFTDTDISQVINFQNGCPQKGISDTLWVNLGIRIPECAERRFVTEPLKRYYHEYECNIRTRLDSFIDDGNVGYSLKKSPEKTGEYILKRLTEDVLPVFEALGSRDGILSSRRRFPAFDDMYNHLILLDEAMIYGRKGDLLKAAELFNEYYKACLREYNDTLKYGRKVYLHKGERIVYHCTKTNKTETVTAPESGYVNIYNADSGHLEYLRGLAEQLDISVNNDSLL